MIAADVNGLALASSLLLPAFPWMWVGIHMNTRLIDRYDESVRLPEAALDEHAANGLRALATQIQDMLALTNAAGQFDPQRALASPEPIRAQMRRLDRVLTARARLRRRYRRMRIVGPMLTALGGCYLLGGIAVGAYFAELNRWRVGGYAGLWICGASLVLGLAAVATYAVLTARMNQARLLAAEPAP